MTKMVSNIFGGYQEAQAQSAPPPAASPAVDPNAADARQQAADAATADAKARGRASTISGGRRNALATRTGASVDLLGG